MNIVRICNGRVIDPSQDLDRVTDLWLKGDHVLAIGPRPDLVANQTIDAVNRIVCPGSIEPAICCLSMARSPPTRRPSAGAIA
jgi:dihydroorotase